jgi:hypothetical protein
MGDEDYWGDYPGLIGQGQPQHQGGEADRRQHRDNADKHANRKIGAVLEATFEESAQNARGEQGRHG